MAIDMAFFEVGNFIDFEIDVSLRPRASWINPINRKNGNVLKINILII